MARLYVKYLLLLALISPSLFSQVFQEEYSTRNDTAFNGRNLSLGILGATFFNNNEFFNSYHKGYTLIGAFLQPELNYTLNSKLYISAGVHLRKYYGDDGFLNAEPLFSINYCPNKMIRLIMGSYEGGQNHKLPETIFSFEEHLSNLIENGILIELNHRKIESQIWLDWERFIEPGDPFREEFTVGVMNRIKLINSPTSINIDIPLYLLAHHTGGQIDNSPQPVQSVYNLAEGFKIYNLDLSFIHGLTPYAELLLHHSFGDYITKSGHAIQFTAGAEYGNVECNAGYFRGSDFMSFRGLPIFHSYTEDNLSHYLLGGSNNVISFKTGYKVKISFSSFLFLRFEGYYNTGIHKLDYTYGLHLQLNDLVNIKSFNNLQ